MIAVAGNGLREAARARIGCCFQVNENVLGAIHFKFALLPAVLEKRCLFVDRTTTTQDRCDGRALPHLIPHGHAGMIVTLCQQDDVRGVSLFDGFLPCFPTAILWTLLYTLVGKFRLKDGEVDGAAQRHGVGLFGLYLRVGRCFVDETPQVGIVEPVSREVLGIGHVEDTDLHHATSLRMAA